MHRGRSPFHRQSGERLQHVGAAYRRRSCNRLAGNNHDGIYHKQKGLSSKKAVYHIDTLPVSLQESAKLDGANDLSIFICIIVLLCLPVLATVVKELSYPRLVIVDDYENAIRTYIDKHPTIDGQPTIGLSLLAEYWRI